jgi:putative DNA methylase
MREEAFKRIGHLYPKVKITEEMAIDRNDLKPYVGKELTVIAWLWARTVKSPNPAFSHVDVPLVSSFVLSSKKGKEAWVEPVVNGDQYDFIIRTGPFSKEAKNGTKSGRGSNFNCILSNTPMSAKYIREEAQTGKMRQRLLAIVAEGNRSRVYLPPSNNMENIALSASPLWKPNLTVTTPCHDIDRLPMYGMYTWGDAFTPRQLVALTTFSDLVQEARNKVIEYSKTQGMSDDGVGIDAGATGATAYGDAVAVYLAFALDKSSNLWSTITSWMSDRGAFRETFARQAIPMVWDFAEANPFSNSGGNFLSAVSKGQKSIQFVPAQKNSVVLQADAASQDISADKIISSDPPYYDNIGYADLSDYFYVWLRRTLKPYFPKLFSTMAVPKAEELVATPYRHGSKEAAETFFMKGMTKAINNMANNVHPAFPVSIYYAFKQAETKAGNTISTGWETFLEAVISSGFLLNGTWPMRTEGRGRLIAKGTNALASSIVLVCKKREKNAQSISRRQFQRELRETMPEALEAMIGGSNGVSPIAPVDLAQSAIGPGMAIYSKYEAVLNQDGSKMSVHDALIMINRAITDHLHPDSGNFDADTLFCDDWFDQYGWKDGPFGEANVLAQAKGTTVDGVAVSGAVTSGGGKVRLLKWSDYPEDWDPKKDKRTPVWEACHQLIRELNQKGETDTGRLLSRMTDKGEAIRQLAYHLYTLCERKKWAEDARAYNELISSWHAIVDAAGRVDQGGEQLEFEF